MRGAALVGMGGLLVGEGGADGSMIGTGHKAPYARCHAHEVRAYYSVVVGHTRLGSRAY